MSAYDSVIKSRAQGRPTAKKFIENIFTDFFELQTFRRRCSCGRRHS